MKDSPSCICGASQDALRPMRWPSFGERKLYACKSCDTVQLFPPPLHRGDPESVYQDASYLSKIPREEYYGYFKVFEEYIRVDLGLLKDMAIVDFGAGWCYYQRFFLDEGYREVHSIEINRHLVRFAVEKLGLRDVYHEPTQLPPEHYDLVISNQVFEHLSNPLETLDKTILPLVKPGGLVCFSVPNWDSLNRPVLGRKWFGYSPEDHIWFFSERSIRHLLSNLPAFELLDVNVRSAAGKSYDGFRPKGIVKRLYYYTVWRLFEILGRGDQLLVTLRRRQQGSGDDPVNRQFLD